MTINLILARSTAVGRSRIGMEGACPTDGAGICHKEHYSRVGDGSAVWCGLTSFCVTREREDGNRLPWKKNCLARYTRSLASLFPSSLLLRQGLPSDSAKADTAIDCRGQQFPKWNESLSKKWSLFTLPSLSLSLSLLPSSSDFFSMPSICSYRYHSISRREPVVHSAPSQDSSRSSILPRPLNI